MKAFTKIMLVSAMMMSCYQFASAQTKKEKQAAKVAKIAGMINERRYVFEATYAIPQRGNSRSLSYGYDLVVGKDSIISYLPYYGRVTLAPIDASDGGIKITSTKFDYVQKPGKKGGYEITITPKENNIQGSKDVRYMILSVSDSGYASLQVFSNNRDPISFNGTIEERKPHK